jgi:hypothetical protein
MRATRGLVFQDVDSLMVGERWWPQIEQALRACRLVVVFWCAHSERSAYVAKEYRSALSCNKSLLPVLLDETPLPDDLAEYHGLDFRDLARPTHAQGPVPPRRRPPRRRAAVFPPWLLVGWLVSLMVLATAFLLIWTTTKGSVPVSWWIVGIAVVALSGFLAYRLEQRRRERRFLRDAFSRYVAPEVVQHLDLVTMADRLGDEVLRHASPTSPSDSNTSER